MAWHGSQCSRHLLRVRFMCCVQQLHSGRTLLLAASSTRASTHRLATCERRMLPGRLLGGRPKMLGPARAGEGTVTMQAALMQFMAVLAVHRAWHLITQPTVTVQGSPDVNHGCTGYASCMGPQNAAHCCIAWPSKRCISM